MKVLLAQGVLEDNLTGNILSYMPLTWDPIQSAHAQGLGVRV